MKKKGKLIIAVVVSALVILAAAILLWRFVFDKEGKSTGRIVYVESVKDLTGSSVGLASRYMGVVEAQETKGIEKDSEKTVAELYVAEGDTVEEGTPLFIYDTEEMELQLQQLELELQGINNDITSYNAQIKDLTTQRDQAPAEDKLSYTSQINNLQAQLKQAQYNLSVKELEITRQQEAIDGAVVTSPMAGVVKTINENPSAGDYYGGSTDNSYITIMATGEYRVKGTMSELDDIYSMMEGTPVIVRSRVDESVTWRGMVDKVDLENGSNAGDNYYGDTMGESATKYSFYVSLDNYDGLMLGQHLYIEMDYGQGDIASGMWLPSYYIVMNGTETYVWAVGADDRIEKRELTLGEYDENMDTYEILSGLTEDDYIAYPEADIEEGMETTTDIDVAMDSVGDTTNEDMYYEDGADGDIYFDENMDDDMYYEDGADGDIYYEDDMTDDSVIIEDEMSPGNNARDVEEQEN